MLGPKYTDKHRTYAVGNLVFAFSLLQAGFSLRLESCFLGQHFDSMFRETFKSCTSHHSLDTLLPT